MNTNNVISLPVSVDLSANANQHKLVYLVTGNGSDPTHGKLAVLSAVDGSQQPIGTLTRGNGKPEGISSAVGLSAAVHVADGTVHFVVASAAIEVGAILSPTTDGKVVTRSTGLKCGVALEAAAADGNVIRAILCPLGPVADVS